MRRLWPVLAALVLSGCATTVSGHGSGSASPTPSDFPATTETAPSPPPTDSGSPTSAAPTRAPRPASCPKGSCHTVTSASLGDGYQVVLLAGPGAGGLAASVVELLRQGVAVFWAVKQEETPAEMACSDQPAKQCAVVAYVGAHGGVGRVWRVDGDTLVAGPGEAQSATSTMHAADLDGDGYIDVLGLQNNYEPDYATGKVYWQTWTSDGSTLTSTGCGPLSSTLPPVPSSVLTATCPG